MAFISKGFLVAALAGRVVAQNKTTIAISVPSDLSTRPLVPDVYGYSIEPIWVDAYINTSLATTLLASIVNVTGKAAPIRVGGNSADQTYLYPSSPLPLTGNDSVALPNLTSATMFNITPHWFDTWAHYFPAGTEMIYTLNFADNSSGWANAVAEAAAAHAALGDSLVAFELGNEVDHFINKHWRDASWGVEEYIQQFRNLTGQITGSGWYKALTTDDDDDDDDTEEEEKSKAKAQGKRAPTFQAGVFADPPLVPDQQDETDDFSIANLTAAGIAARPQDKAVISSYATHLYPQSTCDAARWHRLRLDLLSDHAVVWRNVSQYAPQAAAADLAGAPLVMGETNSVSCSGKSGISDTLGAALWAVDYVLTAASLGVQRLYFHLGAQAEYSAFTPRAYVLKGERLAPGIRAGWYAHYFVARVVAGGGRGNRCGGGANATMSGKGFRVAALPGANSSSLSGFAVYEERTGGNATSSEVILKGGSDSSSSSSSSSSLLRKLVFLDMGVWNGTEGLSNPSTLSATDGAVFSEGTRSVSTFQVSTPWSQGSQVKVVRLTAPGTNAKSNVTVAGTVFDDKTGKPVVGGEGLKLGDEYSETILVGAQGMVQFDVQRAEAVLLEIDGNESMTVDCAGGGGDDGEGGQNGSIPEASAAMRTIVKWQRLAVVVLLSAAGLHAL